MRHLFRAPHPAGRAGRADQRHDLVGAGINDAGVITGRIRVANTGRTAPFIATPVTVPNP